MDDKQLLVFSSRKINQFSKFCIKSTCNFILACLSIFINTIVVTNCNGEHQMGPEYKWFTCLYRTVKTNKTHEFWQFLNLLSRIVLGSCCHIIFQRISHSIWLFCWIKNWYRKNLVYFWGLDPQKSRIRDHIR